MKKNFHLYVGRAGHLYAMSEFLMRGWNVAILEVDVGDDIFVVQDENGTLRRVQVKTSTSKERKNSFSSQFNVPVIQLQNVNFDYLVYYVFVARYMGVWTRPLIIDQVNLLDLFKTEKIGSLHDGFVNFYFSYNEDKVSCSGIDLTKYVADFTDFPITTDTNESS